MLKVDKNIRCVVCNKIFNGGKHYLERKTCSNECLYIYRHTDEYAEKKKKSTQKTFQKKYGVNSYPETKEFSDKIKKTISEYSDEKKIEVSNNKSKSYFKKTHEERENIVKKRRNTKKERWGDETYSNSKQGLETVLKNNNGIHHLRFEENIKKSKVAMKEKYGAEHVSQSPILKDKIKAVMKEKYGSEYYFSSDDHLKAKSEKSKNKLLKILEKNNLTINLDNFISNGHREKSDILKGDKRILNIFNVKCNTCGNEFTTRVSPYLYNIDGKICRKCYPVMSCSQLQLKIENFLQNSNIKYIKGDRSLIKPFEIDFYLPDYNLGIEVNGNYFHSETGGRKDIKYHLNKTQLANKQNVKLIHLFEDEVYYKFNIVKSNIKNLLNMNDNAIESENCQIREINNKEKNRFLIENHIDGISVDKYRYGLYFNEELVSVMTFGKLRSSLKYKEGYELMRFCNKLNTDIVNSFQTLLNYFINKNITKYIKTYADVRWYGLKPTETVYIKNNFSFEKISRPNYHYLSDDYLTRINKFTYSKSNLLKMFDGDKNKSEFELAKENDIDKIWDCGNLVFEYIVK